MGPRGTYYEERGRRLELARGVWRLAGPAVHESSCRRIARRLAADRGDNQSFTRIDPYSNWREYASHPRSQMPRGKGDYTDWMTNYTPEISDRSLTRLARLLDMAPATQRERLLAGVKIGLEQGAAPKQIPDRLSMVIERWWAEQPQTGALLDVAARLGHPAAVNALARAADRGRDEVEKERAANTQGGERGSEPFVTQCAPCHQADGSGMQRLATPLRTRNGYWETKNCWPGSFCMVSRGNC